MKNFNIYKYYISKDGFDIIKLKSEIQTKQEAQNYLVFLIQIYQNFDIFESKKSYIIFSKQKNSKEKEFILFSINQVKKNNIPVSDYKKIKDLQNILKNEFNNLFNKLLQ